MENILIIGAGISGLIAAIELEKAGKFCTILESTDKIGGRVKTEDYMGHKLDHGFQVLLTDYPELSKYLDLEKLKLCYYSSGALIFQNGGSYEIGDPFRNPGILFKMILSPVGTFKDKLLIRKLTSQLKSTDVTSIFSEESQTTMQYLKSYGFSDQMINNFFVPFFGGIFLENELHTSSRMFRFVFKMFAKGYASTPEEGMGQIPDQLYSKLNATKLKLNTEVRSIEQDQVILDSGDKISFDKLIIATTPNQLLSGFNGQFDSFESVTNLYFSTPENLLSKPLIGLVPETTFKSNIICNMSSVSKKLSNEDNLISVSVNGDHEIDESFAENIKVELSTIAGFERSKLTFLKAFRIPKALPVIDDLAYEMPETSVKVQENIFLAGDYLLNGSLNAAMVSGRTAAHALLAS